MKHLILITTTTLLLLSSSNVLSNDAELETINNCIEEVELQYNGDLDTIEELKIECELDNMAL